MCAPSWFYLQDYTRMHGQQNIKNIYMYFALMYYTRSDLPLTLEAQRVSIRLATLHRMVKQQRIHLHVRIKMLLRLQSYASKHDILIYRHNVNIKPQPKNQHKTCLVFRTFNVVNHQFFITSFILLSQYIHTTEV